MAALPFNQGYYQTRLAGWRRPSFTSISAGQGGGWVPRPPPVPAAAAALLGHFEKGRGLGFGGSLGHFNPAFLRLTVY